MEKNGGKQKIIEDALLEEKKYSFNSFTHNDAFFIGKSIVEYVNNKNLSPVRIRIVINNDIVFQFLMEGKTNENWLNKKQRTVEKFKHSSYYIYLKNEIQHQYDKIKEDYAICGGGFPIVVKEKMIGCICVSGLKHEKDHQIIIDVLKCLKENKNAQ